MTNNFQAPQHSKKKFEKEKIVEETANPNVIEEELEELSEEEKKLKEKLLAIEREKESFKAATYGTPIYTKNITKQRLRKNWRFYESGKIPVDSIVESKDKRTYYRVQPNGSWTKVENPNKVPNIQP